MSRILHSMKKTYAICLSTETLTVTIQVCFYLTLRTWLENNDQFIKYRCNFASGCDAQVILEVNAKTKCRHEVIALKSIEFRMQWRNFVFMFIQPLNHKNIASEHTHLATHHDSKTKTNTFFTSVSFARLLSDSKCFFLMRSTIKTKNGSFNWKTWIWKLIFLSLYFCLFEVAPSESFANFKTHKHRHTHTHFFQNTHIHTFLFDHTLTSLNTRTLHWTHVLEHSHILDHTHTHTSWNTLISRSTRAIFNTRLSAHTHTVPRTHLNTAGTHPHPREPFVEHTWNNPLSTDKNTHHWTKTQRTANKHRNVNTNHVQHHESHHEPHKNNPNTKETPHQLTHTQHWRIRARTPKRETHTRNKHDWWRRNTKTNANLAQTHTDSCYLQDLCGHEHT